MKINTQFENRFWIIFFSWLALLIVAGCAIGGGFIVALRAFAKEFRYCFRAGWRTVKDSWNWKPSP